VRRDEKSIVSHLRLHLQCKTAQRNPFSQRNPNPFSQNKSMTVFIYISESTSVEKTLLVRHLPSQLSDDEM
jgi:hypothetical protein